MWATFPEEEFFMSERKKYALVGCGSRSNMFYSAICKDYKDSTELVALCDLNPARMEVVNQDLAEWGMEPLPMYTPDRFEEMIEKHGVKGVVVTTMDRTHHDFISRAMKAGCDVISEKPMTTDVAKAKVIYDTIEETGKSLRVTFNYRYAPRNTRVKELIKEGVIGDVKSVHFEWLLDTKHGADYFRRWHRDKYNSGGLMVHKSTHHFDLVNWWLDSQPKKVYASGKLAFYGRENAEQRGMTKFYDYSDHPNAEDCPFALKAKDNDRLQRMYIDASVHDGYRRDMSVFSHGISIEDDMSVIVDYNSGATMTYHLTAYSPWEGYRVMFNGTKGRLEYETIEKSYVSGDKEDANQASVRDAEDFTIEEPTTIRVFPLFAKPYQVRVQEAKGGHGGGDVRLLNDIFLGSESDPLGHAADHTDGLESILTGVAANRSMSNGGPVQIRDLKSEME